VFYDYVSSGPNNSTNCRQMVVVFEGITDGCYLEMVVNSGLTIDMTLMINIGS